jgi:uncharacterized protein YjbJ (UPF0337 family)
MSAKSDRVKGQAKQVAGILTRNKDLEARGKADRRAWEAKEKVGHAKDKVDEVIGKTQDTVEGLIDKAGASQHKK